jgi:hypothetical protein
MKERQYKRKRTKTLYDKVSQWCRLFSSVSSTSETDVHNTTEILLKVVHNPNYNNVFHLITLQWTQSYTWSLIPGTSVNTIVYMIAHSRYFSEHNRIHDRSLQVLQWTQSYTWSLDHFQQYFSCIVDVSFTGGGNRRKQPTSLTNFVI